MPPSIIPKSRSSKNQAKLRKNQNLCELILKQRFYYGIIEFNKWKPITNSNNLTLKTRKSDKCFHLLLFNNFSSMIPLWYHYDKLIAWFLAFHSNVFKFSIYFFILYLFSILRNRPKLFLYVINKKFLKTNLLNNDFLLQNLIDLQ